MNPRSQPLILTMYSAIKWIFVCGNVGNCKVYHYSAKTRAFRDITAESRKRRREAVQKNLLQLPEEKVIPAKACTRSSKPYIMQQKGETTELYHIELDWAVCTNEDIITLVSDGIHDCLDPAYLVSHVPVLFGK